MRLSKNFTLQEFSCNCGTCDQIAPPQELVDVLQDVRDHFGKPVVINSGYRCPDWNKRVGGASGSKHLEGIAADIRVVGVSPAEVQDYVLNKYKGKYGIGRYNSFTHIDVRNTVARWDMR